MHIIHTLIHRKREIYPQYRHNYQHLYRKVVFHVKHIIKRDSNITEKNKIDTKK